jgi:hypothetical protein
MTNKTKRIFAREILILITSLAVCIISYNIGGISDSRKYNAIKEKQTEKEYLSSKIDSSILYFRKNPKVDSLYKLQGKFSYNYILSFLNGDKDMQNYNFWVDIRRSINDSTFNITYASDAIINCILSPETCQHVPENRNLLALLLNQRNARKANYSQYDLDSLKNEFKLFALNNNFERYIAAETWHQYKTLREQYNIVISEKNNLEENRYRSKGDLYLSYAVLTCLSIFYGLRCFIFIFLWAIRNVRQKES